LRENLAQREALAAPTGRIEIEFPGGGQLLADGMVEANILCAVIRELPQP
jgi:hypothetical protein